MTKQKILFGSAGGVILLLAFALFTQRPQKEYESFANIPTTEATRADTTTMEKEAPRNEQLYVYITGEVKQPGVYEMKPHQRVEHVIMLAGGFTENANEAAINLAEKVSDEMMIVIPTREDDAALAATAGDTRISLSKADASQLQSLPRIGPALSEAIITYREQFGPFESVDDLVNVSGIGPKMMEQLRDLVKP